MRVSRGPEGLGSLIAASLRGLDLQKRVQEQSCLLVWDEVVGDQVADAAQPEFVRDGVLFVTTKSPVWANELTFYKADMIARLNKRVGGAVLKEIVLKAGKVRRRSMPRAENLPEAPDPEGIELSDLELERVEAAATSAGEGAADPVRKLLLAALRLEKWKEAQGWKPCSRCGVLQNTASGVCPPCRMQT
jgi:predicted nucleic acid-binding Zn ribbon protein